MTKWFDRWNLVQGNFQGFAYLSLQSDRDAKGLSSQTYSLKSQYKIGDLSLARGYQYVWDSNDKCSGQCLTGVQHLTGTPDSNTPLVRGAAVGADTLRGIAIAKGWVLRNGQYVYPSKPAGQSDNRAAVFVAPIGKGHAQILSQYNISPSNRAPLHLEVVPTSGWHVITHRCQHEPLLAQNCARGTVQSLGSAMKVQLLFFICSIPVLVASDAAVPGPSARDPIGLPPVTTGSETVKKVFGVRSLRPLEPGSFEPLRKCFSIKLQKDVDQFLRALDKLTATRNRVAAKAGIKQDRWWPANVGADVHVITKSDQLTDRGSVPDAIRFSEPILRDRKLEIEVQERYDEIAADGTDLGGKKSAKVTLVPKEGRWVIDNVSFTVCQYGTTKMTTLAEILARDAKQLRVAQEKIEKQIFEIRTAKPVSNH
jgi:hypothetical protein